MSEPRVLAFTPSDGRAREKRAKTPPFLLDPTTPILARLVERLRTMTVADVECVEAVAIALDKSGFFR